jgi:hypothetical protein
MIIAPIRPQRQALLTERLLSFTVSLDLEHTFGWLARD